MLEHIRKELAENLSELLKRYPDVSRLDLSRRMDVADGTLGRIKYGAGNPQLDVICRIADFFKLQPWQLLVKDGYKIPRNFDPLKTPVPDISEGNVRIPVLEVFPSAGAGGEAIDHPAVLDHIDIAEGWARQHLGQQIERMRALPVIGDSMSPTINEGDLAFVDTACKRYETDGIYVIIRNDRLFIKRLVVDFGADRVEVRSDNPANPTWNISTAQIDGLTVCGRVKAWLAIKGY